jgi:hypothetical protein
MVKEEEKQLLANRCADAGLTGPLCLCVRVCVRSMSVRCTVCPLSFDVATMSLAVSPLHLCRRCSQIMPKARRSFNWENRRIDFPLLQQPIPIFLRSRGLSFAFTTDSLYLPAVSISIPLSFVTLHYSIVTTGPKNQESTMAKWRSFKSISITWSRPASYGHTW